MDDEHTRRTYLGETAGTPQDADDMQALINDFPRYWISRWRGGVAGDPENHGSKIF